MTLTPNGDGTFQITGTGAWDINYPAFAQPPFWYFYDFLPEDETLPEYVRSFDEEFRQTQATPCPQK